MKKILLIVAALSLLLGCEKSSTFNNVDEMVEAAKTNVTIIQVDELKSMIDSMAMFNLIDVREPSEHNYGFIPGSVNIPRGLLEFNIESEEFWEGTGFYFPEKTELFILYCKKGSRSILAAETLKALGYDNVKIIDGGWKQWELTYPDMQEKNLELESHGEQKEVGGC